MLRPYLLLSLLGFALVLLRAHSSSAWTVSPSKTRPIFPKCRRAVNHLENDDKSAALCRQANARRFENPIRHFQTAAASMLVSGVLLLCPSSPASASADLAAGTISIALPPRAAQSRILDEATLPKPDSLGTLLKDNKSTEPTIVSGPVDGQQYSVLDEVWTLIDKYYIDRTFGGQNDWNKVRGKFKFVIMKAKGEDAKFNVVSDMVATLNDKYSRMLDREQYSAIQKYDLIGVGVTLTPDSTKNIVVGAPPIPGSEAARVGLQAGDFVSAINGIPTVGRTAFDIIDQISEDPSAKTISMTVRPVGSDSSNPGKVLKMARAFEKVKNPVRYKISETRSDGTKVGFVKILEFNALVKGGMEKALAELEAAGANAYVIDVRQNTGGAFQSAVEISSLFTEDRVATYVVDSTGLKIPFRTAKGQLAIDITDAMVLWIDGRSASASEVLAGSLHDNCRAVLMGENSFGKGLIQAVYGLKNGAGLVLTVARYVTPSGSDIQGVGITPDLGTQAMPFGLLGLGTDTSKIDFNDIKNRLENVCRIPVEMK